jgi:HD-GYP domain-containing protein (c-di-GMP phosphodiesterase class II)
MSSPRPIRRGRDACHLAFRETLDLLHVTDETLAQLGREGRIVPSQDAVLVRALNAIAATAPGIGQHAPSHVLVAEGRDSEWTGTLYVLGPGGYASTGAPIHFRLEDAGALSRGQETVAVSSVEEEGQALEEYQALFLPEVRERIGVPIRNFISYRITGDRPGAIVAYNYPLGANRYESQVLSSLAVTLGSFGTLASRVAEVEGAFLYLIGALARAAEANDQVTGDHLIRVSLCTEALARAVGLSADEAWTLAYLSQLHDVGKIHTPREILRKRGSLDREEEIIMREHTLAGERIIGTSPRLLPAHRIAGGHHENWDGSGYPRGLAGEEIPLEARIVKVVDVYDAHRSERPYKPAYSHDEAFHVLSRGDARIDPRKHFDPKLLGLFLEIHGEFRRIHEQVGG